MDDIIKMVASKTGMSEAIAKIAVETVVTQLKGKLPPAVGGQIDSLLGGKTASGKSSGGSLGDLAGKLGGMLGKK